MPDRSLTPEEPLPTVAIRAAGHAPVRLSQDARGAGGCGRPQPWRPGAGGRPHGVHLGLRALERPVADQPAVPVATEHASRPGILEQPHRRSGRAANDGPRPRTRDKRLSRRPCRGRWSFRSDRRPVRRRPVGRGVQPGNVSADRPILVACRRPSWGRRISGSASTSG